MRIALTVKCWGSPCGQRWWHVTRMALGPPKERSSIPLTSFTSVALPEDRMREVLEDTEASIQKTRESLATLWGHVVLFPELLLCQGKRVTILGLGWGWLLHTLNPPSHPPHRPAPENSKRPGRNFQNRRYSRLAHLVSKTT